MIALKYQTKARLAERLAVAGESSQLASDLARFAGAGEAAPIVSSEYIAMMTQANGSIHATERHIDVDGVPHFITRVHAPGTILNSTTLTSSAALIVAELAVAEMRELLNG